jgi:hypothetical protein
MSECLTPETNLLGILDRAVTGNTTGGTADDFAQGALVLAKSQLKPALAGRRL